MNQYKVDDLTTGSHIDSVFKAGRVILARLTLPSIMPHFWNSRISVFSEGEGTLYDLGQDIGVLSLRHEIGLQSSYVSVIGKPNACLCELNFNFKNDFETCNYLVLLEDENYTVIPDKLVFVNEYNISFTFQSTTSIVENQRIFLRIQGECSQTGGHTHTAWCILLIRAESVGGIKLKWVII